MRQLDVDGKRLASPDRRFLKSQSIMRLGTRNCLFVMTDRSLLSEDRVPTLDAGLEQRQNLDSLDREKPHGLATPGSEAKIQRGCSTRNSGWTADRHP